MKEGRKNKLILVPFLVITFVFLAIPFLTFGAEPTRYEMLAPLPVQEGGGSPRETTAPEYIPGMVRLIIAVAGALAVLRLIFAGIKYMSTDAFGEKSEAKGDIQGALWGFLLVISAWLILNTINERLLTIDISIKQHDIRGEWQSATTSIGGIVSTGDRNRIAEAIGCTQNCTFVVDGDQQIGTMSPKPPGPFMCNDCGCDNTLTPQCWVNVDLYNKLKELTVVTKTKGVAWQVTELFPPTRSHEHPCHKGNTAFTAKCVDASIRNLECANIPKEGVPRCGNQTYVEEGLTENQRLQIDANKIKIFIEEAEKLGLSLQYEVTTREREAQLRQRLPQSLRSKVSYVGGISGEHFSVYLNSDVRNRRVTQTSGGGDND